MKLSNIIRGYRIEKGITQAELARRAGLSAVYISLIERGENVTGRKPPVPTVDALQRIADAIEMPLSDLLAQLDDNATIRIPSSADPAPIPTGS